MAVRIIKSSNSIEPPTPKFTSSEKFTKYCYLYNALVALHTAARFDPEDRATFENLSEWSDKTLSYLLYYVKFGEIRHYYTCIAPYWEQISTTEILKFVKNLKPGTELKQRNIGYQRRGYQHRHFDEVSQELNKFVLCKQYIYYTCKDDEDGWIVVLRAAKANLQSQRPILGAGKSLHEAEISFAQSQAHILANDYDNLSYLLENEVPITSTDMIDMCGKFDPGIYQSSVKTIRPSDSKLIFTVPSNYSFKCSSTENEFLVDVNLNSKEVLWKVTKYLNITRQTYFVSKLHIEICSQSLQEAFSTCQERFNYLQHDSIALNEAINEAEKIAQKEDEMEYNRSMSNDNTLDWLISEFGEDIMPDRG